MLQNNTEVTNLLGRSWLDGESSIEALCAISHVIRVLLQEDAKRIKSYQKLFNVAQDRFDELHATADEVELKHGLWESLKVSHMTFVACPYQSDSDRCICTAWKCSLRSG